MQAKHSKPPEPDSTEPATAREESAPTSPAPVVQERPVSRPLPRSRPGVQPAVGRTEAPAVVGSFETAPPVSGPLYLDYFGERLMLEEEGCLGREEGCLGAVFFQGNRLISRRHALYHQEQDGRVSFSDAGSLNGVWYQRQGGQKCRLEGSTVILQAGDTLWLYHTPLPLRAADGLPSG